MKKLANSATIEKASKERRLHPRRKIDNYPLSIKKTDGTKIKAHLSNISAMGFQIKCSRLSAFVLTARNIGFLERKQLPDVEVTVLLPYKNGLKRINSICRIVYSAISKETNPIYAFTLGLQVIKHQGNSFRVVKELLYGQELPKLLSEKTRVIKKS